MQRTGWVMVVMGVSAVGSAQGATYYVKESLETKPASAQAQPAKAVSVVAGRLERQMAVRVQGGTLAWDLAQVRGDAFAECWFRPVGWDALSPAQATVAKLRVGTTTLELVKPAGRRELVLRTDSTILHSYPIYNWTRQEWMGKEARDLWHYLNLSVAGGHVGLTIDGFPARRVAGDVIAGTLNRLELVGEPGTDFSWLHVIGGGALGLPQLRNRYRSLYRGKPELHKNTVTIPWLAKRPTIDGTIAPGEWDGAARLVGFVSLHAKRGMLRAEKISAQMGYDDKYVYLTIRTPYQGELGGKHWKRHDMPLWGEPSYEMFFHPPFTGTPDFCQLVGNPYGDQADLKMLNLGWNGRWDWKTTIRKDEWVAEMRADFVGIQTPPPGGAAVWTGNMVNSAADTGWCWTQRYNDTGSFGVWRFDKGAPVIRPGHFVVTPDAIRVPVDLRGGAAPRTLSVTLEVYGEKDVLPAAEDAKTVRIGPRERRQLELAVPLKGLATGTVALYVRDGETELYFHSAGFPAAPPVVRGARRAPVAKTPKIAAPQKKALTDAERAYNRKWTAAELGQTLLDSSQWRSNTLGLTDDVPRPWTPMKVQGQTVTCWGRRYTYASSILPVQITTGGEPLFAAAPRLVLRSGGKTLTFDKASVKVERVDDGRVSVHAVSTSGPFRVEVDTAYEFDGMGKIELSLESPDGPQTVDGLALEFALQPERSHLYHLVCGGSGHAPHSDSGAVPAKGMTLDLFREQVWLGDEHRGFAWFAESLEGWSLCNEKAIEVIEPVSNAARRFRIKLADRPWRLERPYTLVFGIQATPVKPRPKHFRKLGNNTACHWCWFWGDGSYYPFQSLPAKAKAQIDAMRAKGREVMPCSSILFYGTVRFHKSMFGDIPHPGMLHRETMLWRYLWLGTTIPTRLPSTPERHTATGAWYGKKYQPKGITGLCAASPHQDHYVWQLNRLIQETGLGALYLDQPIYRCSNAHHRCGYVNYAGKWTPRMPIFAMRRMIKRIHRLFYDKHGKTFIRWHSSNQLMVPVISFIDVFWDGENYGSGPSKVFEFYSKLLPPGRMQAQHTGIPFGFAPDLLPEFESRYAPSPASERDLVGWFFVHDSGAWPAHASHGPLIAFLQQKRLACGLADMQVAYYWQKGGPVQARPASVKHILHHGKGEAVLILFNRSDETVVADVQVDRAKTALPAGALTVTDIVTGASLARTTGDLRVPILPRDLRMLRLCASQVP